MNTIRDPRLKNLFRQRLIVAQLLGDIPSSGSRGPATAPSP